MSANRTIPRKNAARQRRPGIDHAGVELDEIGAGADLFKRRLRGIDAADADDGASPGRAVLRIFASTIVERSNSGFPDSPPASPAMRGAAQPRPRDSVVLETMTPSICFSSDLGGDVLEFGLDQVGRDLQEDRRGRAEAAAARAAMTRDSSSASSSRACMLRRPGVLGEEMLTVR